MNIRFSYLYRDAGNYKQFGSIVFTNTSKQTIESLTDQLKLVLIDSSYFTAAQVNVPDLHAYKWDDAMDHGWHEFDELEETDQPCDDLTTRDFSDFLKQLHRARGHL